MFKTTDLQAWESFSNGSVLGFEGNSVRMTVRSMSSSAVYQVASGEVVDEETGEVVSQDDNILVGCGLGEYSILLRSEQPVTLLMKLPEGEVGAFRVDEGQHTQPTIEEPEVFTVYKPRSVMSAEMQALVGLINAERNANARTMQDLAREVQQLRERNLERAAITGSVVADPEGTGGEGTEAGLPGDGDDDSRGAAAASASP
nr:MAG: hypothetical protein [Microvirus sp.]